MTLTGETTRTLDVPGAKLTYDVRGGGPTGSHYEPDFDALRAAPTWIVMAADAESAGIMTSRAAFAIAERLGTQPVIFPGGHGGFMGGEYGQQGDPDAFAAKLREVLSAEG